MPRPKKDGVKYSLYIDRVLEAELRRYAARYDLTQTAALERAIKVLLAQEKRAESDNIVPPDVDVALQTSAEPPAPPVSPCPAPTAKPTAPELPFRHAPSAGVGRSAHAVREAAQQKAAKAPEKKEKPDSGKKDKQADKKKKKKSSKKK